MVTAAPIGAKLAANQGVRSAWPVSWCMSGCVSDATVCNWEPADVILADPGAVGSMVAKARL